MSWGEMKMGNIVPRVELEPTSLALQASVLPLHHTGSLMSPLIPTPTCLCSSLTQRSEQTTTILVKRDFCLFCKCDVYVAIAGFL